MTFRFRKHYTVEEARELLPRIRKWLETLLQLREEIEVCDKRLDGLMVPGADLGGQIVNARVRAVTSSQEILLEFYRRELQLKDLDRGLIDFPAIVAGREVFLCWEKDEEDIEHWHDLDTGYAGREPL